MVRLSATRKRFGTATNLFLKWLAKVVFFRRQPRGDLTVYFPQTWGCMVPRSQKCMFTYIRLGRCHFEVEKTYLHVHTSGVGMPRRRDFFFFLRLPKMNFKKGRKKRSRMRRNHNPTLVYMNIRFCNLGIRIYMYIQGVITSDIHRRHEGGLQKSQKRMFTYILL